MLTAPFVLEYRYKRSCGPVLSRWLTGLSEKRIEGLRLASGKVLVPPREYDPETGEDAGDDWVPVSSEGTVVTWTEGWALVRLDGADTGLLHRALGPIATGDRVHVVWAEERSGHIADIQGFQR